MKSQRKVWELRHQTVCKVVGMAFDSADLKKIGKKFGISATDPLMDHDFALHSTAVHLCHSDNKVARHIHKMLETRFARYARRLSDLEVADKIEYVTECKGDPDIPLWAILWDLATRGLENGAAVETALFGFIHMLEHKLMRDYWESASDRDQARSQRDVAAEESMELKRQVLELRSELEKTHKVNEHLRCRLAELKSSLPERSDTARPLVPAISGTSDQAGKVTRLRTLLLDARAQRRAVEEECAKIRKDFAVLAREVALTIPTDQPVRVETAAGECPFRSFLSAKHVAMVGGLSSLECHYRDLVEAMGGTFQRHDGDCRGGECLIEDCVRKADLVVCPVEVNSHNAAKSVKKLCKSYGIACCFPRTAGLHAFRVAIEEHFSETRVA
ncbi:MAG: DUF2325 domain-containing protein [Thermodesulfobacteriota bacterium]